MVSWFKKFTSEIVFYSIQNFEMFVRSFRRFSVSAPNDAEEARRSLVSAYNRLLDKLQTSDVPSDAHYKKTLTELLKERRSALTSPEMAQIDVDYEAEHELLNDEENVLKMMEEQKPWETGNK